MAATSSAAPGSTRTTATSCPDDPPTTSPSRRVPSDRTMVTPSTPSTTCWLVTMYPLSASQTMPEPKPKPTGASTSTRTTDGLSASATATTGSSETAGGGYCGTVVSGTCSTGPTAGPSEDAPSPGSERSSIWASPVSCSTAGCSPAAGSPEPSTAATSSGEAGLSPGAGLASWPSDRITPRVVPATRTRQARIATAATCHAGRRAAGAGREITGSASGGLTTAVRLTASGSCIAPQS